MIVTRLDLYSRGCQCEIDRGPFVILHLVFATTFCNRHGALNLVSNVFSFYARLIVVEYGSSLEMLWDIVTTVQEVLHASVQSIQVKTWECILLMIVIYNTSE